MKSKDQPSQHQQPHYLQQPQETQQMQNLQQPEQPQQTQQPQQSATTEVIAMPPQVQALLLGDQQVEIDRLTSMTAEWLTGEPHRADNRNFYNGRHQSTHHQSTLNMSPATLNYNGQHIYSGSQGG